MGEPGRRLAFRPKRRITSVERCLQRGVVPGSDRLLALPDKPLSSRTLKSYISVAGGLLEASRVERAADLTQQQVTGWLRRRQGRTNDVHRFLSWLKDNGGPALDVRFRARKTIRVRERDMLRRARILLESLDATDDSREGCALLARAIATVHGLRLERVLALRGHDVRRSGGSVELRIGEVIVGLGPALSDGFYRSADHSSSRLFAGRGGIAPYSADSSRYHLRKRPA